MKFEDIKIGMWILLKDEENYIRVLNIDSYDEEENSFGFVGYSERDDWRWSICKNRFYEVENIITHTSNCIDYTIKEVLLTFKQKRISKIEDKFNEIICGDKNDNKSN